MNLLGVYHRGIALHAQKGRKEKGNGFLRRHFRLERHVRGDIQNFHDRYLTKGKCRGIQHMECHGNHFSVDDCMACPLAKRKAYGLG